MGNLSKKHGQDADQVVESWRSNGAPIQHFQEGGMYSSARPYLDLMTIIDTPHGAPAQARHRDTYLPGPAASIGVHIPLTPLQVEPLNGAIGFTPGYFDSQRDVVGAVPLGSVVLYDSFLEHHGLENDSGKPRAALFAWYRVPGIFSGHAEENFGDDGVLETTRWRRHLEERLLPEVLAARGLSTTGEAKSGAEGQDYGKYSVKQLREIASEKRIDIMGCLEKLDIVECLKRGPSKKMDSHFGFPLNSEIVEWREDRVCFSCDHTSDSGAYHNNMWFCNTCWNVSRANGCPDAHPNPSPSNAAAPEYKHDDYPEDLILQLAPIGLAKPGRGLHKLTLLRERGFFIPVDPTSEWLEQVTRDPQPLFWKRNLNGAVQDQLKHVRARGGDRPDAAIHYGGRTVPYTALAKAGSIFTKLPSEREY